MDASTQKRSCSSCLSIFGDLASDSAPVQVPWVAVSFAKATFAETWCMKSGRSLRTTRSLQEKRKYLEAFLYTFHSGHNQFQLPWCCGLLWLHTSSSLQGSRRSADSSHVEVSFSAAKSTAQIPKETNRLDQGASTGIHTETLHLERPCPQLVSARVLVCLLSLRPAQVHRSVPRRTGLKNVGF